MSTRPPLTVYMPVTHGALAAGIARSFARVGIGMMVSGPTMAHAMPHDFRLGAAEGAARYGPLAGAYEGEEIVAAPPAVVMVSNPGNEEASIALAGVLRRKAPVVLVAYSGVFQSRYRYTAYNGVVANDVASRAIARHHGVPALKFFPELDFSEYPFRPEPEGERVVLRSFINDFEQRFPLAAQFFGECRRVLHERFGERVLVENVSRQPRGAVRRKMVEATALLHIKDSEGFGFAILEGMSVGRPLITQRGLARNMAYNEWAVEGRSQFKLDAPDDSVPLVQRLLADRAWRREIQRHAAADVRALDFSLHAENLRAFLDALVLLQRRRWTAHRAAKPLPVGRFVPTLDAGVLQPFEEVALGGTPASQFEELG